MQLCKDRGGMRPCAGDKRKEPVSQHVEDELGSENGRKEEVQLRKRGQKSCKRNDERSQAVSMGGRGGSDHLTSPYFNVQHI